MNTGLTSLKSFVMVAYIYTYNYTYILIIILQNIYNIYHEFFNLYI